MDPITSGLQTSPLGGTKFKIYQSVPSGSIKKGPYAIVRSAALNDSIAITRRFGEGSKPLFARDDIAVNQATTDRHDTTSAHGHSSGSKSKSNRKSSSPESSSPERYRRRESKAHSSPTCNRHKSPERSIYIDRPNHNHDNRVHNLKFTITKTERYKKRDKSKSHSPLRVKKNATEKVPYYRDEQREKDRLKRLYGYTRSRSPPPSYVKKCSPKARRRFESPSRKHTASKDRHQRHSPYRSSRRDYKTNRSRSSSRTRSPQKCERHKHSNRDIDKEHSKDSSSFPTGVISATPQYIPIAVPVPADYAAYSFPSWTAPQPPWHPSNHRAPSTSHFAPFPIWPMIPPMRHRIQPPYVSMPTALPYTPLTPHYRPPALQRHPPPRHNTSNYQSWQKRQSS